MAQKSNVPNSAEFDKPPRAGASSVAGVSEWEAKLAQAEAAAMARFDAEQAQLDDEAHAAEQEAAHLRREYKRRGVEVRARLDAEVAASEERQRQITSKLAELPDDHPTVPGLMKLLRREQRIVRMLRDAEEMFDELDRRLREQDAERDKLRAKLKAGRRPPQVRLTTIVRLPRVAARRPSCRARRAHRAVARAPASASAGSSDGDGRPPPPPPSPPPSPPPPPIDAHALLARLQPKLCRPTGRLLVQQIAAEPRKIGPIARDVAETIARSEKRIAERRRRQKGERP
jgi:hypothetical protein